MKEVIITEQIEKVFIIRFNRAEVRNPLSLQVLKNLDALLDEILLRKNIENIIFTGSGDAFASGANLNEVSQLTEESAREFGLRGQSLMQKIYNSDKLTIAAINSFCMGGALDLAVSCKKRIVSPNAVFAHPGASLGIITGWSGTQILPRLIGKKKALEMFLTAKKIDANEALKIGLIDKISENPLSDALNFQT
jgi:enoyl-CoA hydratase/carnithine racemase